MSINVIFIIISLLVYFFATFFATIQYGIFYSMYYIFVWYCYIFFVDGVIYSIKKNSLIISKTKEFIYMLFVSSGLWFVFEIFNYFLKNWSYINLPYDKNLRYFGYFVSYATVLPAIFETYELIKTLKIFDRVNLKIKLNLTEKKLKSLIYTGVFLLIVSLFLPKYFFPFIWVSFIFVFEPLNYIYGTRSLLREVSYNAKKIFEIFTAGMICGFLWEMWNFKAGAKWIYHLPYLNEPKLFEMPVYGYLGFGFFALECYAIYNFLSYFKKCISFEDDTQTPLTFKDFNNFYFILFISIVLISIISITIIDRYTVKNFSMFF